MLNLNHAKLATEKDKTNDLPYWAELFKATTWERFKALSKGRPDIEEVGNLIFTLNTDNQEKEILEGQRRYREQLATERAAGYLEAEEKYNGIINEITAEKDKRITDMSKDLSEKDKEIAALMEELKKYKEHQN